MTVGENIAIFRKRRALTQSALAEILGVTDKAVSKWERGVSCPDISLLPSLAEALLVSVDDILREESDTTERVREEFISLEKYLMGEYGYVVHDFSHEGESIVLIMDSPDEDDAAHGYPLSGKTGEEFNRFIFGGDSPLTKEILRENKIGVTYVASVPLANLDPPIDRLAGELEYTRFNKYHVNLLLLRDFMKKAEALVLSDTVKVIALTREFNQKYFGTFLAHAHPNVLDAMYGKIASGDLKILFVGPPHAWNWESFKKPRGLFELREYITSQEEP